MLTISFRLIDMKLIINISKLFRVEKSVTPSLRGTIIYYCLEFILLMFKIRDNLFSILLLQYSIEFFSRLCRSGGEWCIVCILT